MLYSRHTALARDTGTFRETMNSGDIDHAGETVYNGDICKPCWRDCVMEILTMLDRLFMLEILTMLERLCIMEIHVDHAGETE